MLGQQYLDLLKTNQLNSLAFYGSAPTKKTNIAYGVIMSIKEIKRPANPDKDLLLTCYISDPSIEGGTFTVNVFSKSEETLNAFQEDCIIRLQNFNLKKFNGNPQMTINIFSTVTVYQPKTQERIKIEDTKYSTTTLDMNVIKALDAWNSEFKEAHVPIRVPSKRPLLETAELYDNPAKYFDYVGQIVNIAYTDLNVILTLTDFTENPNPPSTLLKQKIVNEKYLINCSIWDEHILECEKLQIGNYISLRNCVKKCENDLEFNIHGRPEEKKRLIYKLKPDDSLLKKLIERRDKYQITLKKRLRNDCEAYPLRTEFIKKKRGGFKTLGQIKSDNINGIFETKASVSSYNPLEIEKWIKGYCDNCRNYCPVALPCHRCQGPTSYAYKFDFTLKNEQKEELKVNAYFDTGDVLFPQVLAQEAYQDKSQMEKLKQIVQLATDPANNLFFDFCINTHTGLSQFINTRFILAEDEEDEEED